MCGIFGLVVPAATPFTSSELRRTLDKLFRLSESRGKEAAGLALRADDQIQVYKRNVPASQFLREARYRRLFHGEFQGDEPLVAIGHSRLVTNGSEEVHRNNQPVISAETVGIHNGIIVNAEALWQQFPHLDRQSEVDSEVLFQLISHGVRDGQALGQATLETFARSQGQASIAALFADMKRLLLYTNNGSLYVATHPSDEIFLFASERHILDRMVAKSPVLLRFGALDVRKVQPGDGMVIDLTTLARHRLDDDTSRPMATSPIAIVDVVHQAGEAEDILPPAVHSQQIPAEMEAVFERCHQAIGELKRCSRCVLPETMPFLTFDEAGICNYCHGYQVNTVRPVTSWRSCSNRCARAMAIPTVC